MLMCLFMIFIETKIFKKSQFRHYISFKINKTIIMDALAITFAILFIGLLVVIISKNRLKVNRDALDPIYIAYIFILVVQEEVIFRGYIDNKLSVISNNRYMVIISYLLWSLAHVPRLLALQNIYYWDFAMFIKTCYRAIFLFIFPFIIIRHLQKRHKSLVAPILYHFVNNILLDLATFM